MTGLKYKTNSISVKMEEDKGQSSQYNLISNRFYLHMRKKYIFCAFLYQMTSMKGNEYLGPRGI